jgi:hypothetical protein
VIIARAILSYVEWIASGVEQYALVESFNNIINTLKLQMETKSAKDSSCHFLDNPSLFSTAKHEDLTGSSAPLPAEAGAYWQYDAVQHRLTYRVINTYYFQSSIGSKIEVYLLCKEGQVVPVVSPHRWCQHWRFSDCGR